jgi:hypothetical protein
MNANDINVDELAIKLFKTNDKIDFTLGNDHYSPYEIYIILEQLLFKGIKHKYANHNNIVELHKLSWDNFNEIKDIFKKIHIIFMYNIYDANEKHKKSCKEYNDNYIKNHEAFTEISQFKIIINCNANNKIYIMYFDF